MQRIALIDDDRNILTSLSIMLEEEGFRVDTYTDPERALCSMRQQPPDLAVLDVKMPRMDGMSLLQNLRKDSDIPVVFLTSQTSEADEVLGLHLGADDFLRKPFSPRVLLERLRALMRRAEKSDGQAPDDKMVPQITRGPLMMDPNSMRVTWRETEVKMTSIEFKLLRFLADKPGFARSRDQMMDKIYRDGFWVDDRTVDSHIKRIRKKMRKIDGDFGAIETLYGMGYRFSPHGA
jgi:two-component system, OmpR family, response regulator ChvI